MEEKRLRSGFTTGASARAAAVFLLRGTLPERVEVILPEGQSAVWKPEYESEEPCQGYLRVQKDAGDDPDVTHGSWVYACVTILTEAELETKRQTGSGYWLNIRKSISMAESESESRQSRGFPVRLVIMRSIRFQER